jgi:hypothetical protein
VGHHQYSSDFCIVIINVQQCPSPCIFQHDSMSKKHSGKCKLAENVHINSYPNGALSMVEKEGEVRLFPLKDQTLTFLSYSV